MSTKYHRPAAQAAARSASRRPGRLGTARMAPRQKLLLIYVGLLIFVILLLFSKSSLEKSPPDAGTTRLSTATIVARRQLAETAEASTRCMLELDMALMSGQQTRVEAVLPCAAWDRLKIGDVVTILYRLDSDTHQPVVSEVGLVALPKSGRL
jgi:hypothetical protein